ncbi:TB2/DP1, HVA22 family-domain-containing protein [Dichotomocladium elegans]|nr:TB2/DP1, HVA22 family-domain-containing protein [Dichotomocladium elegans]
MTTTSTIEANFIKSSEGLTTRLKQWMAKLDAQLSQYEYCNTIERCTGVKKSHAALGLGTVVFAMVFFNIMGRFLTHLISWVYPAYASFKAIESPSQADDKQWLTYWTVIGFVQIVEYFTDLLLSWFPFYFVVKTLFVLWLTLPYFRGAEVLYARFFRTYLLEAQVDIDRHANDLRQKAVSLLAGEPVGDKKE